MFLRVLAATILAAAVLFFWGYLFWVVLPLGPAAMEEEPFGGEALTNEMMKVLPSTGVYFIPFPADDTLSKEKQDEVAARHRQGPLVRIFFTKTGAEPPGAEFMLRGFAHNLAIALLISITVAVCAPALPTFTQRLGVAFLIGAVAAAWLGLNEAIWFYHPWKFELYQAGYVLVGGLLMGLVIAAIVKVRPAPRGEVTASSQGG